MVSAEGRSQQRPAVMAKKLNPNSIKIHRSYTVEEAAERLGVHKNTIWGWIKRGLMPCDNHHPMLIHGETLRRFIQAKRTQHKQKCKPWEFYCMKCRKPQFPAERMADYQPQSPTKGCLIALCSECDSWMNKFTTLAKLEQLEEKLEVSIPKALKRINDRA